MKRNYFIVLFVLIIVFMGFGCKEQIQNNTNNDVSSTAKDNDLQNTQTTTQNSLDDLQTTACESADQAGTCDTKLADLGLVTKDKCCQILGKCC